MRSLQSAAKQEIECGEEMQFGGGGTGGTRALRFKGPGNIFFYAGFQGVARNKTHNSCSNSLFGIKNEGEGQKKTY